MSALYTGGYKAKISTLYTSGLKVKHVNIILKWLKG